MKVNIKKLNELAVIPSYTTNGACAMDLTCVSMGYDKDTHTMEYKTGLSIEIPEGYVGLLFPRSSISKVDLMLTNSVGVIDSDYRGEICMRFKVNAEMKLIDEYKGISVDPLVYKPGDRIGQLLIIPHPTIEFQEVAELSETQRGTGGFGSTGG